MIQELFNGMLTILLAKFAINDLPHAAGVLGTSSSDYKVTAWDYGVLEYRGEDVEPIGRPFHTTAVSPLDAAEKVARTSPYATEPLAIEEIPAPTTLRGKPGRFFKHQVLLLIYQVEAEHR